MDKIKQHIIGDIVSNEDIGYKMRKWREIFSIPQIEISRKLNLSPSVISDYESGRRKNPGVAIVRKYVNCLIEIDKEKGGKTINALRRIINPPLTSAILQIKEYDSFVKLEDFLKVIDGKLEYGTTENINIFGHTVVDSVKAILEMNGQDFINLYGWTTERALIFTNVSSGRSPLVAIRVSSIKPRVVVLHGCNKLDKLALEIAKLENIILITTNKPLKELLKILMKDIN